MSQSAFRNQLKKTARIAMAQLTAEESDGEDEEYSVNEEDSEDEDQDQDEDEDSNNEEESDNEKESVDEDEESVDNISSGDDTSEGINNQGDDFEDFGLSKLFLQTEWEILLGNHTMRCIQWAITFSFSLSWMAMSVMKAPTSSRSRRMERRSTDGAMCRRPEWRQSISSEVLV